MGSLLSSQSFSPVPSSEMWACLHFNTAEVKRWQGENEVSWFRCFAINDDKLQCRRQWLEACCTSARGRGEQRERRGVEKVTSSAGTNSHHSDLVCVCAHVRARSRAHAHHTHLPVSVWHPFLSATLLALSLPQMWEMKRIGGVMFKCGNALAKSAISINRAACIQYSTHAHIRTRTYIHEQAERYAVMWLLLEEWGGAKTWLKRPVMHFLSSTSVYSVSSGRESPESRVMNQTWRPIC